MLGRGVGGWAQSVLARGIRWRLIGSALIVITAAIAVGSAVVGPLFLRAGGDSLVRGTVASAPASDTSFELVNQPSHPTTLPGLEAERRALLRRGHLTRLYGSPIATETSFLALSHVREGRYASRLTYRTGICSVLHFDAGGCGTAPGDIVVSSRSARRLGTSVGSTIPIDTARGLRRLRVTGIYRLPNVRSAYWFGAGSLYFEYGQLRPSANPKLTSSIQLDDFFVASPGAFVVPAGTAQQGSRPGFEIDTPLRRGVLGIGNASTVKRSWLALEDDARNAGYTIETGLPTLLRGALHQQSLMNTIVALAALQLVLLAIWVLTSVLLRSADLRRAELRVARLRGFPPRALLAVSITEPAALCAIGAVLGIAGGWVLVRVATSGLFAPGTTVRPDGLTFAGFGAVLLTICGVLGLTTRRLLRSSGLSPSASRSSAGRSRVVIDVSILAVAIVALVGAATSGALSSHGNPVAAAAPALIALGTSVIAIRIVELACRRLSAASLDSSAVAGFLAVRRIGRRPAVLREGRTLVIAVGVACFAVCAWSVARANRLTDARYSIGASTVVTVAANDQQRDRAVDAVDPRGRFAMGADEISTSSTTLIGVDASRMAAIAAWPAGTTRQPVAEIGRALAPRPDVALELPRGAPAVSVTAAEPGVASRDRPRLNLGAWLFDPVHGTRIVNLGRLRSGTFTYPAVAQAGCPCRLIGLGVLPGLGVLRSGTRVSSSGELQLGLDALAAAPAGAGRAAPAELTPAAWQSTTSGVRVVPRGSGVAFDIPMSAVAADAGPYEDSASAMASLAQPAALPAVAGSRAESLAQGTLPEQGLDGKTINVRPVAAAASLPRIGSGGVFVDLGTLEGAQLGTTISQVSQQVWLGPRAPANAVGRLRAAGLRITGVRRAATIFHESRRTGPALAYDFMLLATLVALLVAAVGTFSVLAAGGRQRATEMAALEVAGVRRSILVRSLAIEAGILALTALFGVAAGTGSAAITLSSLPQVAMRSGTPLSYALPVGLILAVALGTVLVVGAATALAARGILARMSPSLLRTAADDVD